MDKKKIGKIVFVSILFAVALVFIILFGVQVGKANKTDISVSRSITVSSRVDNMVAQTYKSTVTGAIKNNTNQNIQNVIIYINVKTKALGHTGDLKIEIASLGAGQEYNINKIFDTKENFEKVEKVSYRVDSGNYVLMKNKDGILINGLAFLYLIPSVLFLAIGIICTKNFFFLRPTIVNNPKKSNEEMLGEIITNQQEIEKERIALEKEKLEKENQEKEIEKPVYCQYCGTKNSSKDTKCNNCGSNLN